MEVPLKIKEKMQETFTIFKLIYEHNEASLNPTNV